jgi:hypothetical protein
VSQRGARDLSDIGAADRVAVGQKGADLGRKDEGLHAAGTDAVADEAFGHVSRVGAVRVRAQSDAGGVALHELRGQDLADCGLHLQDLVSVKDGLDLGRVVTGGALDDARSSSSPWGFTSILNTKRSIWASGRG